MIIIVYDFDIVIIGVLCVQILILRLKKRKTLAPPPKTGAANILSQWSRREEDAAAMENEWRDCGRVKVREWVWTEKVGVKLSSWVNTKKFPDSKILRVLPPLYPDFPRHRCVWHRRGQRRRAQTQSNPRQRWGQQRNQERSRGRGRRCRPWQTRRRLESHTAGRMLGKCVKKIWN